MKYEYNLNTFYNEDDISYYLLGVFCTDGNVRITPGNKGRAQIGSKDYDWLIDINKYISPNKSIDKGRTCFLATYNSIELVRWLISNKCVPNKSLTLETPNVPDKYVPDFIRGCWDGDGTLGLYRTFSKTQGYNTTKRSCSMCSGSQLFIEGVQALLNKLSITSKISVRNQKPHQIENRIILTPNKLYVLTISGKSNIIRFCQTIYYNSNPLSLKRKEDISKQLIVDCTPKLSNQNIKDIQNDPRSLNDIAAKYGIGSSTVSRIKRNALKCYQ